MFVGLFFGSYLKKEARGSWRKGRQVIRIGRQ
jgi:hypothetical protein